MLLLHGYPASPKRDSSPAATPLFFASRSAGPLAPRTSPTPGPPRSVTAPPRASNPGAWAPSIRRSTHPSPNGAAVRAPRLVRFSLPFRRVAPRLAPPVPPTSALRSRCLLRVQGLPPLQPRPEKKRHGQPAGVGASWSFWGWRCRRKGLSLPLASADSGSQVPSSRNSPCHASPPTSPRDRVIDRDDPARDWPGARFPDRARSTHRAIGTRHDCGRLHPAIVPCDDLRPVPPAHAPSGPEGRQSLAGGREASKDGSSTHGIPECLQAREGRQFLAVGVYPRSPPHPLPSPNGAAVRTPRLVRCSLPLCQCPVPSPQCLLPARTPWRTHHSHSATFATFPRPVFPPQTHRPRLCARPCARAKERRPVRVEALRALP